MTVWPYPWESCDEQQQTTRLDMVIDRPGAFVLADDGENLRIVGCPDDAEDWCPVSLVHARARVRARARRA